MSHSTNKKQKVSGMYSIKDMFKRQHESSDKNSVSFTRKSRGSKSRKSTDKVEPVVEVIDVDDCTVDSSGSFKQERITQEIILGYANKSDLSVKKNSVSDNGKTNKSQSRLSLSSKRKKVSTSDSDHNFDSDIPETSTSTIYSNENASCEKNESNQTNNKPELNRIEVININNNINSSDPEDTIKQPYYLKNFETILSSVKNDTDNLILFEDADFHVLKRYYSLSEQARQLYVRLFGRKFKWIPLGKLKYPEIAENLAPYLLELKAVQLIYSEDDMTDLKDVFDTLTAGDIKSLAKLYHVTPSISQKKHVICELIEISQRSTVSSMFGSKGGIGGAMLKKAKSLLSGAFKLQKEARSVFIRVMTLFSLVNSTGDEENSNGGQGQLFQMLMVNMGLVVYPSYHIDKIHKVFKTRADLIRYEHSLQLESDMLVCIDKGNWTGAFDVYNSVSQELEKLQSDEEIQS